MLDPRSASGTLVLSLAIENRQSKFEISCGGIAQLVERQLCKLEVRGSNPLASSPESFRGCRAVTVAKADTSFGVLHFSRELRLGKPV